MCSWADTEPSKPTKPEQHSQSCKHFVKSPLKTCKNCTTAPWTSSWILVDKTAVHIRPDAYLSSHYDDLSHEHSNCMFSNQFGSEDASRKCGFEGSQIKNIL
jgi:hypothetical protein